tara:strand:+ start:303 stop:497 length:195 start_codon:yes stop_codon:yes gene_type:complete
MEEMVSLKKGSKIIKRTKANYEANTQHWKNRGFSVVNDKAPEKKIVEKAKNVVKLKPKKKKGKK